MKLVSAVIITYKRPVEVLWRAILNVWMYCTFELIVINDVPEEIALPYDEENLFKI